MNIQIQQPQAFDLVGNTILISGNAVGFEGQLNIRVSEGHDEYTALAMAGSTSIRQFQASITIPANHAFKLNRLFVTVTDEGGEGDGVAAPSVTVPVLFGPMILAGYEGYWEHKVVAGETLSSIARHYFEGDTAKWTVIQHANQNTVTNPNTLRIGQMLRIPRNF
ncbi:MAG: Gmad2 immunoglobulin-like domain-containing protein [Thiothrix sp.]|uniref:LysM peptidoglycan-binding domain-containing protein n=1 Tax=Thiothrix sp. TaxID=1032 RepID=UPI00260F3ECF|nr:Gmad2 immunoglobulin-like domain-containing protein [Thiothrix sp.]MDD5393793.1 Gmad2 immunoglobulin-like domain-containing protein [Thiothrix sp.]